MTTEGTATAVIVTGTESVTTDATGTEDTTGIVIDGTTTGGLEGTKGTGGTDENARRGLVEDAKTTCRLMALQRLTAATARGGEARNVGRMEWALQNEGAPPQRMRFRSL
jgi:hypothetical protein